jgi:serine/threonine-protein kinase
MPFEAGSLVGGRYRLGEAVGKGGFGEVFAASDTRTGQPVAVKVLTTRTPDGGKADPFAKAMFEQEEIIPQMLAGHGIVPVLDRGEQDSYPYYVMPFLEGASLQQARKALTEQETVEVLTDALKTLNRVHRAGIVHRDIKPANIFINDHLEADLIDFGLAKMPGQDYARGAGTPGYMSPEQAARDAVDARADVWAMGATAYDILSGHPPQYSERMAADGPHYDVECPVFPLALEAKGVPKDLAGVFDRALECDPAKRYADAGDMLNHLTPYAAEAMREQLTGRGSRSAGTPTWAPAAAIVALLALSFGGVVAVSRA